MVIESTIPPFRDDGYLPDGVHLASESQVLFRFGASSPQRRRLAVRLRRWLELARTTGCSRFIADGSFVTAKDAPNDIDAVVLLPFDFQEQLDRGVIAALELEGNLISRRPEEIFAAEDEIDWADWVEFFSRTREADGRRKGLVEILL